MVSLSGTLLWIVESSGEGAIADSILLVHITAGIVALLSGMAAIVTVKGGSRHNRAGKFYGVSMVVVVVTALPLSVWIGNWFLFAIAIFSGYLVAAGYRIVLRQRSSLQDTTVTDYTLHGMMLSVGTAMIGIGGYGTVTGTMELGSVLAVFGLIGGILAVRELSQYHVLGPDRTPWFERHIAFMSGGYIATVTAAITVNLSMLPPLVRWLGPTLIGVPLIGYAIKRYRPIFV